jgi:hypothetical protein
MLTGDEWSKQAIRLCGAGHSGGFTTNERYSGRCARA